MKIHFRVRLLSLFLLLVSGSCSDAGKSSQGVQQHSQFYKPWESLGELFHEIQMSEVFEDSKTFVDCVPKRDPKEIVNDYKVMKSSASFNLKKFVLKNFEVPASSTEAYKSTGSLQEHLKDHWAYLTRSSLIEDGTSTLIALPDQYVIPGGRFREIYYWDSYFTLIGLGASGRVDLVRSMVDNFAYLIDTIGYIPNGNRTYYLGRSQPPFFASMVNTYIQLTSVSEGLKYLPIIQKEYDFWMDGAEQLSEEHPSVNRVVRLSDGTVLNRYWDFLDLPRPESYKEDVEMASGLAESAQKHLYRNLRAGAESGWDYSTRWFKDKNDFGSIRTTEILPVDLNSLMYSMETILTSLYEQVGDADRANAFYQKSQNRKEAIQRIFWDVAKGCFTDYVWTEEVLSDQLTLACVFPLYFRVATQQQAVKQAEVLRTQFLHLGGLVTTTIESGQQWDAPNGWAPLQWVSIKGLQHYGLNELAAEVANRWLKVNEKVYANTGKMMEKYNVSDTTLLAGGGEYPTQDGFGWSNGVVLGLLADEAVY